MHAFFNTIKKSISNFTKEWRESIYINLYTHIINTAEDILKARGLFPAFALTTDTKTEGGDNALTQSINNLKHTLEQAKREYQKELDNLRNIIQEKETQCSSLEERLKNEIFTNELLRNKLSNFAKQPTTTLVLRSSI